jgi:hypothetical protein
MVLGSNAPHCPAGGNHSTVGSGYVIRNNPGTRVSEQSYWRTCGKCSVVMAQASADGSQENPCAGGGSHAPQGEYFMTMKSEDTFWRWCSKCQSLALNESGTPGPCPAGGTHDHSLSGAYVPPRFAGVVTQIVALDLQPGQTYTSPTGSVVVQVVSLGSTATVRLTIA